MDKLYLKLPRMWKNDDEFVAYGIANDTEMNLFICQNSLTPYYEHLYNALINWNPNPPPPHSGLMWGNVGDFYGIWRHG